jgi:hypothetical protein
MDTCGSGLNTTVQTLAVSFYIQIKQYNLAG